LATVSQIKSPVWTYSIDGGGAISEGLAAIRQCIDIIIRTTKGTDPLRPEFGSDVYKYVDHPVNVAVPNIKKAILEAIETWETRVKINYIKHKMVLSQVHFEIGYKLKDDSFNDSLTLILGSGGVTIGATKARLILQGLFPPNPSGFQFQVQCKLNGADLLPAPPPFGFADAGELYLWVKTNWLNYGHWYLTSESLVGYMNPQYGNGSLAISILTKNRFQGGIPRLQIGYKYNVSITVDGTEYMNDEDLFTPDQVRIWAQENLGDLGLWQIISNPGSFNDDFNDDFEIFLQLLVIYTSQTTNVVINITSIPQ
jgi:phage baseplate assembly protein W